MSERPYSVERADERHRNTGMDQDTHQPTPRPEPADPNTLNLFELADSPEPAPVRERGEG